MNIQPLDIVIYIVNIAVLYALLRVLLYKPVHKFMADRQQNIQAALTGARSAQQEATELKQSFDQQLKNVDEESQKRLMDGAQKASEAASAIVTLAQQQAQDIVAKAHDKAEAERKQMIASLEPRITDMAVELAGEILKREVGPVDNQKVIDAFFQKAVQ